MKVLVADDDRDLRDLVGFTLTQAGYLVIKAPDGTAAIRAVADEAPDLVILDINMPGATGFQVCETVRRNSRVPIMMLTVRGEEEDLVRALELGADDYLTKPFSPRTLLARAKALLRRAGTESASVLSSGNPHSRHGRAYRSHRRGGDHPPHQARIAAAADAARERGPDRQLRSPAGARLGSSRLRRPPALEAARPSSAPENRAGSGRAAAAADRLRSRLQAGGGVAGDWRPGATSRPRRAARRQNQSCARAPMVFGLSSPALPRSASPCSKSNTKRTWSLG